MLHTCSKAVKIKLAGLARIYLHLRIVFVSGYVFQTSYGCMTPSGPLPVSRDVRDRDPQRGELTEPKIIFYNEKLIYLAKILSFSRLRHLSAPIFYPNSTIFNQKIYNFVQKNKNFSIISSRKPSKKS